MTILLVDRDFLKEEVYADQTDPVLPMVSNPEWGRFNEFSLLVGKSDRSDTYDQGQLKSEIKAAADWDANPRAKPNKSSREIRAWNFSDEVGGGDITVDEIISIVRNANQMGYFLDGIQLITYFELLGPDPFTEIPTWGLAGATWYLPGSYNTDEQGNITTQKTWAEWAGDSHPPVEINGKWYVSSFAGVPGNVPCSLIILFGLDAKNVVADIISVQDFQALQPTP